VTEWVLREGASAPSRLPVAKSPAVRNFLLASAAITAAMLLWLHYLRSSVPTPLFDRGFFVLFAVYDYWGALWALLILAIAALAPAGLPYRHILRFCGDHPVFLAIVSALAMCAGAVFVYQNRPWSADEYAPFLQSQIFAAGRLTAQVPPQLLDWVVPKGFQDFFFNVSDVTGRIASAYWPSFALLLTPFTWLGIPWACNPVISACTLLAIHRLTLQLFEDREAAGLAVLFTIASPVFFADGISYYSMSAHLLANTVYALLLIRPTAGRALVAGLVGSIALTLHNPFPHLLFAVPWAVWLITRDRGWRLIAALAAGYLPLCLVLGVGWFWFSHDLTRESLSAGAANAQHAAATAGFPFMKPSPVILIRRVAGLCKLWLWAVPGLPLLALVGAWKWRRDAPCLTIAASALCTLAGYMFFWADQGHGWGYRYFHSAWMVLPVFAAGALIRTSRVGQQSEARSESDARQNENQRGFAVACALITLLVVVPLRGAQIHAFIVAKLGQEPGYLSSAAATAGHPTQVEFIVTQHTFYSADLVQNDPFLSGAVLRLVSHGPAANEAVMHEYFPNFGRVHRDARGEVWSAGTTIPRSR
jgi:hypothetical protein